MLILLSYKGYFYEWEHDRTVNGNVKVKVVDCIEIRWVIQYYSCTLEKLVLQWLYKEFALSIKNWRYKKLKDGGFF